MALWFSSRTYPSRRRNYHKNMIFAKLLMHFQLVKGLQFQTFWMLIHSSLGPSLLRVWTRCFGWSTCFTVQQQKGGLQYGITRIKYRIRNKKMLKIRKIIRGTRFTIFRKMLRPRLDTFWSTVNQKRLNWRWVSMVTIQTCGTLWRPNTAKQNYVGSLLSANIIANLYEICSKVVRSRSDSATAKL